MWHKMLIAIGAVSITFAYAWSGASAQDSQPSAPRVWQGFDLQVPHTPALLTVGREKRLTYELHLTSFARSPLTLIAIELIDEQTGRVVGRLHEAELEAALHVLGAASTTISKRTIETGRRAIVYVDLAISAPALSKLRHRVEFESSRSAGQKKVVIEAGQLALEERPLPILGPPLRGGPWVAVYDPQLERGHRRFVYAVAGRAVIPGRHAIDWMLAKAPEGSTSGSVSLGAGADVLAVADAIVASSRDGVAEPEPNTPRPPVALGDATGNYVALDLGAGRYAFYEHLALGLVNRPGFAGGPNS